AGGGGAVLEASAVVERIRVVTVAGAAGARGVGGQSRAGAGGALRRAGDQRTVGGRRRHLPVVVGDQLLLRAVAQLEHLLADVVPDELRRRAARLTDEIGPQLLVVGYGGGVDERRVDADLLRAAGLEAEIIVAAHGACLLRGVAGAGDAAEVV